MILKAFSLLDQKVGTFSPPFFMSHVGQAIRAVTDLGQDLNTTVGRHPSDFALCEVGTFDDNTGQFEAMIAIHHGTVLGFLPSRTPVFEDMTAESRQRVLEALKPNGAVPHSSEGA